MSKTQKRPQGAKTEKGSGKISVASMTGFGKAAVARSGVRLEIELRSVNNRFLDVSFKLPRIYSEFESDIRTLLAESMQRGRVEVNVARSVSLRGGAGIEFNRKAFDTLSKVYGKTASSLGVFDREFRQQMIFQILNRRDVLEVTEEPADPAPEKKLLLEGTGLALEKLLRMRIREGARLGADIRSRLAVLDKNRSSIMKLASALPGLIGERLQKRLSLIREDLAVDPQRLEAEIALLADKSDVTEELVRLGSHLDEFHRSLSLPGSGRKLDFLLQEFGREFNTIASKSADAAISRLAVESKAELEKIREQVQNIE